MATAKRRCPECGHWQTFSLGPLLRPVGGGTARVRVTLLRPCPCFPDDQE